MHHITADRVGARIHERRVWSGLSLADLEALSGVGKASISRMENGHKYPSIQTLDRLCAAMGWTLSQFFRGLT